MDLTVLVPTYKRTSDLLRCLKALAAQMRAPLEIILLVRRDDTPTMDLAREWADKLHLRVEVVDQPGQVYALNAGLSVARGEVIAITDDDTAPRPDWLLRIEEHFRKDPDVGGVGGRDWVHHTNGIEHGEANLVGVVQWTGRLVGNHHIGVGTAREVQFLKGANMSYRTSACSGLAFDDRLRGRGAQVDNDLAFSLGIRRKGWKLIYDPEVAVDHYPAPRFDLDQRGRFNAQATEDASFNRYWAIANSMAPGTRKSFATFWVSLVGTRSQPGYLHLIRGLLRRDPYISQRWQAASRGRSLAKKAVLLTRQ